VTQVRSSLLLAGACLFACISVSAQVTHAGVSQSNVSVDLAFTYSPERAQIVPSQCCFWMHGGSVDAALNFGSGFGIAASFTGEHAATIAPGVDVNKITSLVGPRYTFTTWSSQTTSGDTRRLQVFGQALFGSTYAFNGIYPAPGAPTTSASSFAIEAGGGINFNFSRHFGLRLAEAEYVRTELPNNGTNTQNDLRMACGVTFHL